MEKSRLAEARINLRILNQAIHLCNLHNPVTGCTHLEEILESANIDLGGTLQNTGCTNDFAVSCVRTPYWEYAIEAPELLATRINNPAESYTITHWADSSPDYSQGAWSCVGAFCEKLCGDTECAFN